MDERVLIADPRGTVSRAPAETCGETLRVCGSGSGTAVK